MLNLVWKEIYMCKILYLTGGNIEDKTIYLTIFFTR